MAEEETAEAEAIVVDKSRDGRAYFDAFRSLEEQLEEERKRVRAAALADIAQHSDDDTSTFLAARQSKAFDRLGLNYFAELGQHWGAISRADQKLPQETDPLPAPDPDAGNFAFTQVYDDPMELDLRAHPPRERFKKRRPKTSQAVPMDSFDHDSQVWDHFKKFVQAHDSNVSQLKQICETLPSPSPASPSLFRLPPLGSPHLAQAVSPKRKQPMWRGSSFASRGSKSINSSRRIGRLRSCPRA
jgi:hypothetical protein